MNSNRTDTSGLVLARSRLGHPRAGVVLALAMLVLPVLALAQTGGSYDLHWNTLSQGGISFAHGGAYRLGGSLGQPDAGRLSAGNYVVNGGFWVGGATAVLDLPPGDAIPKTFASFGASPNPFRGSTRLAFDLPVPRHVRLSIISVDGRLVRDLIDEERNAGRHLAFWDGRDLSGNRAAAGIYFVRLRAREFHATHRIANID